MKNSAFNKLYLFLSEQAEGDTIQPDSHIGKTGNDVNTTVVNTNQHIVDYNAGWLMIRTEGVVISLPPQCVQKLKHFLNTVEDKEP